MYHFSSFKSVLAVTILAIAIASCSEAASLRAGGGGRNNNEDATMIENEESDNIEEHNRQLAVNHVPCNGGAGPINYFDLDFQLTTQGGWNLSKCTSSKKKQLGTAINKFLQAYGLGSAGVGDNAAYVASVCKTPSVTTTGRRQLLNKYAFLYSGGGACRFCKNDNLDGRRELWVNTDPNWFNNVYRPEMQNILRNAFTQEVAPQHTACLGNGPVVNPIITAISKESTNMKC